VIGHLGKIYQRVVAKVLVCVVGICNLVSWGGLKVLVEIVN
jgi:hypothetical protein